MVTRIEPQQTTHMTQLHECGDVSIDHYDESKGVLKWSYYEFPCQAHRQHQSTQFEIEVNHQDAPIAFKTDPFSNENVLTLLVDAIEAFHGQYLRMMYQHLQGGIRNRSDDYTVGDIDLTETDPQASKIYVGFPFRWYQIVVGYHLEAQMHWASVGSEARTHNQTFKEDDLFTLGVELMDFLKLE